MPLTKREVKYVASKLERPPESISNLLEDDRDANLVLSEVSVRGIKKEDVLKDVTPLTFIKLVTFRHSYDTNFNIEEKEYVASAVHSNYLAIKKYLNYKLIADKENTEKRSQYLLITAAFFSDSIPIKALLPTYLQEMRDGFRKNKDLRELSEHSESWIDILKEIHRKNWLSTVPKIC